MRTVVYYNRKTKESFVCSLEDEPHLVTELFERGSRTRSDFDRGQTTGFVRIRPTPGSLDVTTFPNPNVLV